MPSPYSNELRQKVLDAFDSGQRKSHISCLFNISRSTIDLWLQRLQETGSVSAARDYRRGPQGKIADLEQFRAFAREQGNLTQKDMAAQWHEPISDQAISKALRRIGFTRKKRVMAIKSVMKLNGKPS
jgi:transposase